MWEHFLDLFLHDVEESSQDREHHTLVALKIAGKLEL